MANRHGLIAGATGTGKTVTLRVIAESFSRIGVPVFMADIKGDVSGIAEPGQENPKISERVAQLGIEDFTFAGYPVTFWHVYGQQSHPVRTTIPEMGPLLLSRLLDLNETQTGVLNLVFKVADDNGMLLLDLKDLRAMLQYVGDNAAQFKTKYGNVSPASIGSIQRALLKLEGQDGERFFGEPALDLDDLMQTDSSGRGVINILAADKLINAPQLYATFLLWLLSELFERLPEVGDPEKPKLVFFFDEAHLLFNDAPQDFAGKNRAGYPLDSLKRRGRLFRHTESTGHSRCRSRSISEPRATCTASVYTARSESGQSGAQTFRQNKDIDVVTVITELGVGEALVSFLNDKGQPNVVDRALIFPPPS
jgi:hypothetical protein